MASKILCDPENPLLKQVDTDLVRQIDQAFDEELMCSQVTFCHGAKRLGYDEEMALLAASGFGWGMQNGERCGAVTGSLMALGLKYGYRNLAEFPNYKILKEKQKEFDHRFREGCGSLYCKELLKANYGVDKERALIYAEERYRYCSLITAFACEILDDLLGE
ncbi:MAG: C_GCAxxG_C_C family protein [Firmicutes bacterium]|nr:C_GCAxxG_C_C family protein [Bacillota bacterium]